MIISISFLLHVFIVFDLCIVSLISKTALLIVLQNHTIKLTFNQLFSLKGSCKEPFGNHAPDRLEYLMFRILQNLKLSGFAIKLSMI